MWKIKKWAPKTTKAEFKLRRALEKTRIPFQTQVTLHGKERQHCVDFYIAPNLVVEVDGKTHTFEKQQIKDAFATADLENAPLPFTVLRVTDHEVWNNIDTVLEAIKTLLNKSLQTT